MPPLVIATNVVFDFEYDDAGLPLVGVEIVVTLFPSQGAGAISPLSTLSGTRRKTVTDSNGRWQFLLVPTPNISVPAGSPAAYYVASTPTRGAFRFIVPSAVASYQASQNPAP